MALGSSSPPIWPFTDPALYSRSQISFACHVFILQIFAGAYPVPGAGQSPYRDTRIARTQPTRANGRKERHPKKTVTRTVVVGGPAMVGSLCLGACESHREEERLEVGVRRETRRGHGGVRMGHAHCGGGDENQSSVAGEGRASSNWTLFWRP